MTELQAAETLFYLLLAAGVTLAGLGLVEMIRFYAWLRRLRRVRQDVSADHATR